MWPKYFTFWEAWTPYKNHKTTFCPSLGTEQIKLSEMCKLQLSTGSSAKLLWISVWNMALGYENIKLKVTRRKTFYLKTKNKIEGGKSTPKQTQGTSWSSLLQVVTRPFRCRTSKLSAEQFLIEFPKDLTNYVLLIILPFVHKS